MRTLIANGLLTVTLDEFAWTSSDWILANGYWNDLKFWRDERFWID